MRKVVFLFLIFFSQVGFSQTNFPFYSLIHTDYSNTKDLVFLDSLENKILDNIKNIDKRKDFASSVIFYSREWKMEYTVSEVQYIYSPNIPKNSSLNTYETFLFWNNTVDTCLIWAFSKLYELSFYNTVYVDTIHGKDLEEYYRTYNKKNNLPENNQIMDCPCKPEKVFIGKDTLPWISTPLGYYPFFLTTDSLQRLDNIVKSSVMQQFEINKFDSNLISKSSISIDSTILYQSPTRHFSDLLTSNFYLEIKIYSDPFLSKPLTMDDFEDLRVVWDSTNKVEDPNKLGTFVYAPIKNEYTPISINVIYSWKFGEFSGKRDEYDHDKKPISSLSRHISAIGIEYSNHKTVYFNYEDVKELCKKNRINFEPYNQLFISAGSKKINLQTY